MGVQGLPGLQGVQGLQGFGLQFLGLGSSISSLGFQGLMFGVQ